MARPNQVLNVSVESPSRRFEFVFELFEPRDLQRGAEFARAHVSKDGSPRLCRQPCWTDYTGSLRGKCLMKMAARCAVAYGIGVAIKPRWRIW